MTHDDVQHQLYAYAQSTNWRCDESLQVDCCLSSPVAITGDMCLDSLIGRAVWFQALGPSAYDIPRAATPYDIPLPLKRVGSVWSASSAQFLHGRADRVTRYRRRWCEEYEDYAKLPKKLITFGFDFKDRDIPVPITATGQITWYACGDRAAIQSLLDSILYLGKRHGAGSGRISAWHVKPIPYDYSIWREGVLMRPVPLSEVDGGKYDRGYCAYKNPYWHPANYAECAIPPSESF